MSTLQLTAASTLVLVTSTTSIARADKTIGTQKLIDQAKEKFDDQQYDESVQKLSAALLRPDVTREQKVDVYRALAYNYIVLKQDDLVRTAVYALYALDEDYALPRSESPRFREPFAKYKEQWRDDGKPGKAKPTQKPPAIVTIKQSPIDQTPHDRALTVQGSIDDADRRVDKVSLFYRTGSSGKFVQMSVTTSLGSFRATIPGAAMQPPIIEYYVEAFDEGGLPIATRGDADTPLRVAVEAEKSDSVFGTWWFWTGAGAVVVGGIVAGVLLSSSKKSGPSGPTQSAVSITVGE